MIISGEVENAGHRGPGGNTKGLADCVAEYRRLFSITGNWTTATLNPRAWCDTIIISGEGYRFILWLRG